jgi:hypothetical protein
MALPKGAWFKKTKAIKLERFLANLPAGLAGDSR